MKRKIIIIIELILLISNNNLCKRCDKYTEKLYQKTTPGPFTNTGLNCGKENPKEQTDCTKYGTDSGMYCCWVANNENDINGKCHLISLTKIERNEIDGCAKFSDSYWSCGNLSNNISINKILFGLLIISYFFILK